MSEGWTTPGADQGGPARQAQHGQPQGPPPYGQFAPRQPVAVKPGIVPLRPLGLGEIYDGAFQAIRRNPRTMLATAAGVIIVLAVIDVLLQLALAGSLSTLLDTSAQAEPAMEEVVGAVGGLGVYGLVSGLLNLFGISVITGMLILVVSRAVLGQRMSLGQLWTALRPRLLALFGINLVVLLAWFLAFVVPVAVGLLGFVVAEWLGALLILLGLIGGAAAAIFLYTKLSMAVPAMVLEEAGIGTALGRTWGLVRGSFWRVLGILLLTAIISWITAAIISAPFGLLGGGLVFMNPDDALAAAGLSPLQLVLGAVGTIIANTIVYPFTAAVTALLYIDLRMRREGLDVELARAAGPPVA